MTYTRFYTLFAWLWVKNVLVGIDQLAAAICGLDPDETLSSWFGKQHQAGTEWVRPIVKILDWIDPRHCAKSIEHDEGSHSVWVFWRREYPKVTGLALKVKELEAEVASLRTRLAS